MRKLIDFRLIPSKFYKSLLKSDCFALHWHVLRHMFTLWFQVEAPGAMRFPARSGDGFNVRLRVSEDPM